jgi:voltage-gated potassium channel
MSLLNPATNIIIKDLVSQEGNEIYRVLLPQQYINRVFIDTLLDLKKLHGVITIGIERNGECLLNPSESETLRSGDMLLVLSTESPSL